MSKTFSLDLGTASIGYAVRNTDNTNEIIEQLDNYGSVVFQKGVGNSKTGEFSYAAEKTKHRSSRRLYQARKYRIWKTLEVLIQYGFCPLSIDNLDKWRKYDKEKDLKRQYPVDAIKFEQWVRLDFDGDGNPDYSSPYQLRAELATIQLDFSLEINRYKLGRALYHIAQRRGFKSSKGETLKEQEEAANENLDSTIELDIISLKKSEEKKSKDLKEYMSENNLKTVGCAFAKLEKEGIRIRASIYQAVRSQYKKEIEEIFNCQRKDSEKNREILSDTFFNAIYSDRKDGSIFYKRPLRSQKGLVGKCTLEPTKPRCPISHPEFEKFRAFSFINNIQYRISCDDEWQGLTPEKKLKVYKEKFLQTKSNFKFEEIRKWIEREIGKPLAKVREVADSTINYSDKTNVAGCPISGRLKNLLGDDWENFMYETLEIRRDRHGKEHTVTFNMEDIWHICFSSDDEDFIAEFAKTKLHLNDKQTKSFVNLWAAVPQGYSMLSLKAIRDINRFLTPKVDNGLYKGFIYTEAALLAKIPEILGEYLWSEYEKEILESIRDLIGKNKAEKRILNIANSLIATYKSLEYEERFAHKNTKYILDDIDKKDIERYTQESFGEKFWEKETQENKRIILDQVADKYQQFFATSKRDYFRLPKLADTLKSYLADNFQILHCENNFVNPQNKDLPCRCDACKKLKKLYHPSMIEFYKPAETDKETGLRLLESPVIGAFKNPMAMRTLHQLRKLVNYFIKEETIDEETRIVVETARDLNDANMRWAIETYQQEREAENKEIAKSIKELQGEDRDGKDIEKARLLIEQHSDYLFDKTRYDTEKDSSDRKKKKVTGKSKDFQYKKNITKYKLWLEQGMECIYTGKIINMSNLFDEDTTDFEHTIPRSQSFDNSLANLTVCDSYYNRHIKKNRIPTQLENYDKSAIINGQTYSAIKPRLEKWEQKVEQLRNNVEFWKQKSKQAQTKKTKDDAIRQKHLWQMELEYWQNKLDRFTMTEVTSGFKHSQLNDTRLITKYAFHYLKSVFSKVEVQKGSVTADFRKMLGVQSVDEKKNRDKHSHHAIDAVILSLIPVAAKRDRMLELFYKIQEEEKLNRNTTDLEQALQKEFKSCQIGNIRNLAQNIEENILINHISKDQTLTPAKRKARKNGKIIGIKDENGKYLLEDNGEKSPKYWIKGNCIRGRLHKDSFFGAIKYPEAQNDILQKSENGMFIYPKDKEGKDVISMVKRVPINSFTTEADFEKIIDPKVKFSVRTIVIQRLQSKKTFKEAINEPTYMLDKNGNEKRIDKYGNPISPIRHIRCRVAAGRGYFTKDKAIQIKEQTYKSTKKTIHIEDKSYKHYYYAQNDGNYLCLLYEFENKKKNAIERKFILINYFEITQLNVRNVDDIWNEPYFQTIKEKDKQFELSAIIKTGTKILMKKEDKESLAELELKDLYKRLFVVYKFNLTSVDCIYLQNHIEARKDADIKEDFTVFNPSKYQARLTLVANNFCSLIEGKDFEMNIDGTITFLRKANFEG
jgi:CRISPR-associated endonuclease Csn1